MLFPSRRIKRTYKIIQFTTREMSWFEVIASEIYKSMHFVKGIGHLHEYKYWCEIC